MLRHLYDETHDLFRDSFRSFVAREVSPHVEKWEEEGIVDKATFRRAGEAGFLGIAVPEELGRLRRGRLPLQRHHGRAAVLPQSGGKSGFIGCLSLLDSA
jgi:alkylation response protein AidB-like acyl-CoA dehydrogenase